MVASAIASSTKRGIQDCTHICTMCKVSFPLLVDAELQTEEEKFTPLHLSARYQPRYYDYDIQQQESEDDVHVAADSEEVGKEEEDVSYLASSRKATKFLVEACNVDVSAEAYGLEENDSKTLRMQTMLNSLNFFDIRWLFGF